MYVYPDPDSPMKKKFQTQALGLFGKAYCCLKDDYRRCHLQVNDWRLRMVATQLPFFMKIAQSSHESIDKVEKNLQVSEFITQCFN